MKKSKAILLLLRLPFLVVTTGAIFVGTAFAWWQTGQFNLVLFLLTFLGACFLHISCNVANDYFDFRSGNDASFAFDGLQSWLEEPGRLAIFSSGC